MQMLTNQIQQADLKKTVYLYCTHKVIVFTLIDL